MTTGCVLAGENSYDAAIRETKEELGITLCGKSVVLLDQIFTDFHAIIDVWIFTEKINDEEIVLEEGKVIGMKWAYKQNIYTMVLRKEFISTRRLPYLTELP